MTGRDEDFLLWHMPYARGLRYLHAVAVMNGQTMELVEGRPAEAGMRSAFQELQAAHGYGD